MSNLFLETTKLTNISKTVNFLYTDIYWRLVWNHPLNIRTKFWGRVVGHFENLFLEMTKEVNYL